MYVGANVIMMIGTAMASSTFLAQVCTRLATTIIKGSNHWRECNWKPMPFFMKDVPLNVIVAGVPAKIIKYRNEQ